MDSFQSDSEELNPDIIPSGGPTPDEYLSKLKLEDDLLADRQSIHEFDELKNKQHIELEEGGITKDRLEEMDAELLDAMPASVMAHVPELSAKKIMPSVMPTFAAEANPMNLSGTEPTSTKLPAPIYDPMG